MARRTLAGAMPRSYGADGRPAHVCRRRVAAPHHRLRARPARRGRARRPGCGRACPGWLDGAEAAAPRLLCGNRPVARARRRQRADRLRDPAAGARPGPRRVSRAVARGRSAAVARDPGRDPQRGHGCGAAAAARPARTGSTAAGAGGRVGLFLLSDTPGPATAEAAAVDAFRAADPAPARIRYRRRTTNTGYKAGNIMDLLDHLAARLRARRGARCR